MSAWQPPETAPKDGKPFLATMAGPSMDICVWVPERQEFIDYYFKQRIANKWAYMIAWMPLPEPAKIGNGEVETSRLNGWR